MNDIINQSIDVQKRIKGEHSERQDNENPSNTERGQTIDLFDPNHPDSIFNTASVYQSTNFE